MTVILEKPDKTDTNRIQGTASRKDEHLRMNLDGPVTGSLRASPRLERR